MSARDLLALEPATQRYNWGNFPYAYSPDDNTPILTSVQPGDGIYIQNSVGNVVVEMNLVNDVGTAITTGGDGTLQISADIVGVGMDEMGRFFSQFGFFGTLILWWSNSFPI